MNVGPFSCEMCVIPPSGLRNCVYRFDNLSVSCSENPPYASRVVMWDWTGVTKLICPLWGLYLKRARVSSFEPDFMFLK